MGRKMQQNGITGGKYFTWLVPNYLLMKAEILGEYLIIYLRSHNIDVDED